MAIMKRAIFAFACLAAVAPAMADEGRRCVALDRIAHKANALQHANQASAFFYIGEPGLKFSKVIDAKFGEHHESENGVGPGVATIEMVDASVFIGTINPARTMVCEPHVITEAELEALKLAAFGPSV